MKDEIFMFVIKSEGFLLFGLGIAFLVASIILNCPSWIRWVYVGAIGLGSLVIGAT